MKRLLGAALCAGLALLVGEAMASAFPSDDEILSIIKSRVDEKRA